MRELEIYNLLREIWYDFALVKAYGKYAVKKIYDENIYNEFEESCKRIEENRRKIENIILDIKEEEDEKV